MGLYADLNFYLNDYYGDVLTPNNALKYLSRASDMLDVLTFGRLKSAYPAEHTERVRKAACALAEVLCRIEEQQEAMGAQKSEDGSYHGAVASITSGKQSISYASAGPGTSVYTAAAASESAKRALCLDTACLYLANVPDANGVNLLYAGEGRYAQRNDHGI